MTLFLPLGFSSKYYTTNASNLSKPTSSNNQFQETLFPKTPFVSHVLNSKHHHHQQQELYSPFSFLCFSLTLSLFLTPAYTKMTDAEAASFEAFLEGWLVRQREYLDELLSAKQHHNELHDDDMKQLINRVLCHYGQYYEEKSSIAHRNIILVFSPPWFSSFEKAFFWVGGFKPGMTFQVVTTAVEDLSEEQRERLNMLKQETKRKERDLNDELAKLHESVAAPPLVEMARSHGRVCLNRSFMVEEGSVSSNFREALENLVASADDFRTSTALKIVQILTPFQTVKFLVAVAEFQLRIRSLGLDKDANNGGQG